MAAESDGSKTSSQDSRKDRCLYWTTQLRVGASEESREGHCVVSGESPPGSTNGEECADEARRQGEEDDEEETESGGSRASRLVVCLRQGEGAIAVLYGIQIADAVEKGDGEAKGVQKTNRDLSEDGFGQVAFRVGEFFSQVSDSVGSADSEGAVEDAGEEGDATGPAGVVGKVAEDELV